MQARISHHRYDWAMPGGRPPTKPAPKFGQRMSAFRIAKGLSQSQLADKLGMKRDLVAYYERSAKNPSLELVQRIADFFGVTVGELLNDIPQGRGKLGAPSQLDKRIAALRALPRERQKLIIDVIDTVLRAEQKTA